MAHQSIFKLFSAATNLIHICKTRLPILYQPVAGIKQETKFLLDKLKVPERPKKPLTAYFRFLLEYRGKVLKENPGIKITEVTKTASEAWRELDEAKKADYEQQHRDELDRYTKQYLDYEAKLTDEQRAVLQAAKEEKLQERKKRKLNKLLRDTNKPKRPLTSYIIFSLEESKRLQKSPLQIASHLKEKWAQMSESEKEKYKKLSEENKAKYETDIVAWEKRMEAEGNEHLVRKSSRVEAATPSRLARKPKKFASSDQGESEKIDKSEERVQEWGLFEKVKKIFKS